jgi:flagellum-specific peptidoglycan hydrolase FlgJ
VAKRTYEAAVELFAMLCKQYGLNPLTDICSHKEGCAKGIASNHGDPEHLWNGLKMGYTMDTFRKAVKAKMNTASETSDASGTQASAFKNLSESDVIAKVGPLFTADQKKNGILASVSLAQFILESGYGKSELAQNANNCFGMKKSLSGNTWSGSAWDGKSTYTKQTQEEENGKTVTITAEFRKYASVEDSIADHSAYLLGAKNGSALRYSGLNSCTDYKKAAQLIKDGGYATSSSYVSNLCSIIEKWNLTKYDVAETTSASSTGTGMTDADCPFLVQISISDLNIRKGAGTNYAKTGKYTGKGVFTITEVKSGTGSKKGWGKLKSGAGWISLDYATRV